MNHALGPLLYTDTSGASCVLEVSTIFTIVPDTRSASPGNSRIQLLEGSPVDAMEPVPVLFRRWVEVLSFVALREPANFPGYRDMGSDSVPGFYDHDTAILGNQENQP